ncbi:hypothetical protein NMK63_05865 [Escherichia coli]|nr:hypothetical protein NMK63_05865 [Escherichia coli]
MGSPRDYFRPSGNGDFAPCGKSGAKRGASSTVSEVRPSSPSGAEATGVTALLSYLASESEGSLKVQGWSASGGRAEVVSDAEGTGGKAVKLTKEAGKSSWVLEYAAGNGAALLQKGGQIAAALRFRERWLRTSMLWRFTGRYLHCHRALP